MSEDIILLPQQLTSHPSISELNRIPHKVDPKVNHKEWHYTYYNEISDMYDIYINFFKELYPKVDIDWDHERLFDNFSRMIYFCSSRSLIPGWRDDESEDEDN